MSNTTESIAKVLEGVPPDALRDAADEIERSRERELRTAERDAKRRRDLDEKRREDRARTGRAARVNQGLKTLRRWAYDPTAWGPDPQARANAHATEAKLVEELSSAAARLQIAELHEDVLKAARLRRERDNASAALDAHRQRFAETLNAKTGISREAHHRIFLAQVPPLIFDEFVAKIIGVPIEDLPDHSRVVSADPERGVVTTFAGREFTVFEPLRRQGRSNDKGSAGRRAWEY